MDLHRVITEYIPINEQEARDRRKMLALMEEYSDLLSRENEIAHFTASSWIVSPAHDQVLMAYHRIFNSWGWTGGHADGDGDLLRVSLREAREETSIQIVRPLLERPISLEVLPVNAHLRRGQYVAPHLHLNLTYLLEADDRQPIAAKPDENKGVKWFPIHDAVEASTEPNMQNIYRKLNARLYQIFP